MNKKPIKILLIEDDPFISEIYWHKLTDAGFEVKLAKDGLEGVVFFKEFQPNLVLLDILLPKKNGWKVLKEIKTVENSNEKRDKSFDAKIFMLTNLGEKDNIQQALKMGADDYFVKASLTPSELVELIKERME